MMKLIHIADSHLGRMQFSKLTDDGSNLRETLIYDNFLKSIECIIDKSPDVVLHAGDLFDSVKPKTKALLVAMQALELFEEANIPFIAIAGNHSMQKNTYTSSIFEVLHKAHPEAHFAYSFKYEYVKIGDALFHLIPNMLHAEDYKKAAMDASAYNRENQYCNKCNHILVTHGLASTISDKRLSTVAEFELTPNVLLESYDYIALGHYHGQMQVAPNAYYSGSQEYLTYGEITDIKGGLVIDTNTHVVEHLELPHARMINTPIIDCIGISTDDIIDKIARSIETNLSSGDMAQVTLDFGNESVRSIPVSDCKTLGEGLLDLKIRYISKEITIAGIPQQDLHAINYVEAFIPFVQQQPLDATQKVSVQALGIETLKTVTANHLEDVV